jgi:NAD(P)-dependent dehydrogenase (short-subunit alcohol dehydrogenase family)
VNVSVHFRETGGAVGTPPNDKVAVVTGAASGIGLAIAHRLAHDGLRVALFDLDVDAADAAAEAIRAGGGQALAVAVDVGDRSAIERGVTTVRERWGPVTVLVNNAGKEGFRRFLEISVESWEQLLAVNLTGVFHLCQIVLPDMIDAGWGRIVNISSSSTQGGQPLMAHYVSSKSGVNGLTKTLALEFGRDGVTVNAITPGFIDTPMTQRNAAKGRLGPEGMEGAVRRTPVGRAGLPQDIAATCSFLCSDEASYVTGQILGVNGGRNT